MDECVPIAENAESRASTAISTRTAHHVDSQAARNAAPSGQEPPLVTSNTAISGCGVSGLQQLKEAMEKVLARLP